MKLKPHQQYKDSGIEWIGELPESWGVRRIKTLSIVKRGASPRPIDDPIYFDDEGEYSWVRISDVTASNKYLYNTTEKLSILGKSFSVPLKYGNLFISIAGSVGKPIITKIKCCIHDGFVYFQGLTINPEYLYYIFLGSQAYQGLGKLGTQLNLNTETIGNIFVPFPTIEDQSDIVYFLDTRISRIDEIIDKYSRLIELLDEKRTALINHVVTHGLDLDAPMKDSGVEWIGGIPKNWEIKRLKNVSFFSRGFDLSSDKFEDSKFPVYGSNGIIGYHNKSTTKGPNITIGRSGSIGAVNFIKDDFWAHNTCLYLLNSFENDIKYLYYLLISLDLKRLGAGSAVGTLNRNYIHDLIVPMPLYDEQVKTSKYLDEQTSKMDLIVEKIQKNIELLKEYKKSLIHHVVTGKVDVRGEIY